MKNVNFVLKDVQRILSLHKILQKSIMNRRCFIKKLLLKILQYSQKTPMLFYFLNKNAALQLSSFIKKRLKRVNIAKFLRTTIL